MTGCCNSVLPPVVRAAQVSVMEAVALLDKADVPFEDLLRDACTLGRSTVMEDLRKHPASEQVRFVFVCGTVCSGPHRSP